MKDQDILEYRMSNQHLIKPAVSNPADIVKYMGAVQAQDFAAAKWALGLRLGNSTDHDIEQAYNKGAILRTHLMRPTWHFVAPEDIRWLLALTAPRIKSQCSSAYRQYSLTEAIFKKSHKTLEKILSGGKHLTRTEIAIALNKAGIPTDDNRFIHLMMRAELDVVICSGPVQGKQLTYALLEERVPQTKPLKRDEALAELAKRYLTSHGPATLRDFAWWSGLTITDAKNGLQTVAKEFISEQINGVTYWFSAVSTGQTASTIHLLPNYDEYIISYKDRDNLMAPKSTPVLDARGSIIFNHTILIDGQIAGTWKRVLQKDTVAVTTTPFYKLNKKQEAALANAIKKYGAFIGKEPV